MVVCCVTPQFLSQVSLECVNIAGVLVIDSDRFISLAASHDQTLSQALTIPGPSMVVVDEAERMADKGAKVNGVKLPVHVYCRTNPLTPTFARRKNIP